MTHNQNRGLDPTSGKPLATDEEINMTLEKLAVHNQSEQSAKNAHSFTDQLEEILITGIRTYDGGDRLFFTINGVKASIITLIQKEVIGARIEGKLEATNVAIQDVDFAERWSQSFSEVKEKLVARADWLKEQKEVNEDLNDGA